MIVDSGLFYLYRHIRLDKNEPFYIGIGRKWKSNYTKTTSEYGRAFSTNGRNNLWNKIVAKTTYKVEIIMESESLDFIKEKEREFIHIYGRIDLRTGILANFTDGGDFGNLNPESKNKISKYQKSIAKYGKDNRFSKKYYQYNLEGGFIKEWDSLSDIKRELGEKFSHVVECVKGELKSVGGFQWKDVKYNYIGALKYKNNRS